MGSQRDKRSASRKKAPGTVGIVEGSRILPVIRQTLAEDTAAIFAAIAVVVSLWGTWEFGQRHFGLDFYQFWLVPQAVRYMDVADIYSESDRERVGLAFFNRAQLPDTPWRQRMVAEIRKSLETFSTPFLYTVFSLFASGDYERDYSGYLGAQLIATVLAILVLCRTLHYSAAGMLLAAVLLTAYSDPFRSDIGVANVGWMQLAMLILFLWLQSKHDWRGHHLFGGMVLGAAVMFKPNVALVAVMLFSSWLINRRFKKVLEELVGMTAGIVGALAMSSWYFRSLRSWLSWLQASRSLLDAEAYIPVESGNFSLTAVLRAWTGLDLVWPLALGMVAIANLFAWLGRGGRVTGPLAQAGQADREHAYCDDVLMVGLGCAIELLVARLSWLHYFVLLTPLIVFTLRPRKDFQVFPVGLGILHRLLGAAGALAVGTSIPQHLFGSSNMYYLAAQICLGTILLYLMALWDLVNKRT